MICHFQHIRRSSDTIEAAANAFQVIIPIIVYRGQFSHRTSESLIFLVHPHIMTLLVQCEHCQCRVNCPFCMTHLAVFSIQFLRQIGQKCSPKCGNIPWYMSDATPQLRKLRSFQILRQSLQPRESACHIGPYLFLNIVSHVSYPLCILQILCSKNHYTLLLRNNILLLFFHFYPF